MTSFLSPLSLPAVKSVSLVCFFIDSCFLPWCLQYEIGKWRNTKTHCKVHKNGLLNMICQFLFGRNNSSKNILVCEPFLPPRFVPNPISRFSRSHFICSSKKQCCVEMEQKVNIWASLILASSMLLMCYQTRQRKNCLPFFYNSCRRCNKVCQ